MQPIVEQQVSFGRGMNDTASPSEFAGDEVELLVNGRVSFRGNTIQRRMGSARRHAAALNSGAQGYGGFEFFTAAGAQQVCVMVGDKFYYSTDAGLNWTNPAGATSLTTAYWSMVQMRVGAANYLCMANGSNNIYYWDGTTFGTLSNNPGNGVKYLAVFNDRLWAAGHSGVTIAASAVGDPNTWATPSGLTVEFTTHDGEQEVTALYQIGPILLAFKRESTGYLEGFGFQTLEVEAGGRGLSRSVGCIAHRSLAPAGEQGCAWLSELGFVWYTPGQPIQLISRPIQAFLDGIAWTNIKNAQGIPTACWWPQKSEYWCAIPSASAQNDYVFRWRAPTQISPPCIMLDKHGASGDISVYIDPNDGNLHISTDTDRDQIRLVSGDLQVASTGLYGQLTSGDLALATAAHDHTALFTADRDAAEDISAPWSIGYDGFVRWLEYGDKDDNTSVTATDGEAVQLRVLSRPMLFGNQLRKKRLRTFRIASQQDAASTLTVTVRYDGTAGPQKSLSMPVTSGSRPTEKKSRTSVKGYALQLSISTTDSIEVGSLELTAQPLREGI